MRILRRFISYFGYAFPLEGNGNQLLNVCFYFFLSVPLDTLSRLKGMETHRQHDKAYVDQRFFGSAFPLEGNGNNHALEIVKAFEALDPLSRLKGMETRAAFISPQCSVKFFGSAFPLEGNGNTPLTTTLSDASAPLDPLSRLKGMETLGPKRLHF